MQRRKRARKGSGRLISATSIAKKLAPRNNTLTNFGLPNINPAASVIIPSKPELSDDSMQIVDDIINIILIDNAIESIGLVIGTYSIYTELNQTPECEALFRTYRDKIYKSIYPPNTNNSACSNALARLLVSRRQPISSSPPKRRLR